MAQVAEQKNGLKTNKRHKQDAMNKMMESWSELIPSETGN